MRKGSGTMSCGSPRIATGLSTSCPTHESYEGGGGGGCVGPGATARPERPLGAMPGFGAGAGDDVAVVASKEAARAVVAFICALTNSSKPGMASCPSILRFSSMPSRLTGKNTSSRKGFSSFAIGLNGACAGARLAAVVDAVVDPDFKPPCCCIPDDDDAVGAGGAAVVVGNV